MLRCACAPRHNKHAVRVGIIAMALPKLFIQLWYNLYQDSTRKCVRMLMWNDRCMLQVDVACYRWTWHTMIRDPPIGEKVCWYSHHCMYSVCWVMEWQRLGYHWFRENDNSCCVVGCANWFSKSCGLCFYQFHNSEICAKRAAAVQRMKWTLKVHN